MHYASGVERIIELCQVQNAKIISLYKWNEEQVKPGFTNYQPQVARN